MRGAPERGPRRRQRSGRVAARSRKLWLSLYLPALALEAIYRGAPRTAPTAVTHGRGAAECIIACNEAAAACGVHPGMGLSAAYALNPQLQVRPREEAAESASLGGLAAWSGQFTSCTSLVPGQGLLLEVGGSLALFGGLRRLLDELREGMAGLGYGVRIAVAPTPLAAWLLARAGWEERVLTAAELPARLAPVPLACMDLPAGAEQALQGMGVFSFGDCCRLPREGLARRIDAALPRLLDRALGKAPDAREPWRAPDVFMQRLILPAPVSEVEALLFAIRRLLLELRGWLRARAAGARRLELELAHHGRLAVCVVLELVAPNRDLDHLLGLFRERLEHLDRGLLADAAEEILLRVQDVASLAPRNLDLFDRPPERGSGWEILVERLRARLGETAVQGLHCVPAHRPEEAWLYCPPGQPAPRVRYPLRPLWLLEQPRALRVSGEEPWFDGPLRLLCGAERIETGWWDGRDVTRDYFIAENGHGERFWIFRERGHRQRWFVHGVFA